MTINERAMAEARRRTDAVCEKYYANMGEFQGWRKKPQPQKKGRGVPASAGSRVDRAAPYIKRSRMGRPEIPVIAIYPNGRERRFGSAKEAAAKFGCSTKLIQGAVTGYHGQKTARGLRWKYDK